MKVDARRARFAVLAVWAAFFVVLWLTGASSRYLGARTQWLVPFGAVTLTLAAALSRRGARGGTLGVREGAGLLLLVVPVAAALLVPHAELGAYAASRKSSSFFPAVKPAPATSRAVTLLDIRVAERDDTFALLSHIHPGARVRLTGIVTHAGRGAFSLTRFYITCCVADAQPLTIAVASPRPVRTDSWVKVVGKLKRADERYTVVADRVTPMHPPGQPYLDFSSL